jgi:hypothetical protein
MMPSEAGMGDRATHYRVDIAGGFPAAQYVSDYVTVFIANVNVMFGFA